MIDTSTMSGTFVSVLAPGASRAAAMSFSALLLAPTTATSPRSGPPPTTRNLSTTGKASVATMVVLSRIYTRTGDDGTTGLGDFTRTPKTALRLAQSAEGGD